MILKNKTYIYFSFDNFSNKFNYGEQRTYNWSTQKGRTVSKVL